MQQTPHLKTFQLFCLLCNLFQSTTTTITPAINADMSYYQLYFNNYLTCRNAYIYPMAMIPTWRDIRHEVKYNKVRAKFTDKGVIQWKKEKKNFFE